MEENQNEIKSISDIKNKKEILMLLEKENQNELKFLSKKIINLKSKMDSINEMMIKNNEIMIKNNEMMGKNIELINNEINETNEAIIICGEKQQKLISICFDKYSYMHDKEITEEYLNKFSNKSIIESEKNDIKEKSNKTDSDSIKSGKSGKSSKSNSSYRKIARNERHIIEKYIEDYIKDNNLDICDRKIIYRDSNNNKFEEYLYENLIESLFGLGRTSKFFMRKLDLAEENFRKDFRKYLRKTLKIKIIKDNGEEDNGEENIEKE